MHLWDKMKLRKRYIIEFIDDNFFMNLYAALATYCFFENKPEALPVRIEKSSQLGFF